jgi:hypothetical protein
MARSQLVDDELWGLVKPLLPDRTPRRTWRPRVSDRAAFTAIVFVLVTGLPWRMVPRQIGCAMGCALGRGLGSGSANFCDNSNAAGRIDWSRGVVDSSHIRAL